MSKRSPLLSAFHESSYEIGERGEMRIALRARSSRVTDNFLADISALRRRLFVGRSAPQWLREHDVIVPEKLLSYKQLNGGATVVRLHRQQYLLTDGLEPEVLEGLFRLEEGRYDNVLVLPYEAAEMACGGPYVTALMAELCPMDLSATKPGSWIATRLAHCEATLRCVDEPLHYRVVCTPADAQFLFGVLSQVTREHDGTILGFDDYRERVA